MRRLLSALLLSGGLACATTAHAESFILTGAATGVYGGSGGSATLTANADGAGHYTVTGITINNAGVMGYSLPPATVSFNLSSTSTFTPDNLLTLQAGQPYFDASGLGFNVSLLGDNTTYNVDLYSANNQYFVRIIDSTGDITGPIPVNLSIASTPEPSSLLLLGTGVVGLGGLLRRRYIQA